MNEKTLILAQVMMTFMQALAMSGIWSLIALSPTALWLSAWSKAALFARPIDFSFSRRLYLFSRFTDRKFDIWYRPRKS